MKRVFRAVGSLSPISSSESSHLSSHHHVDAAGVDTAYLSTFPPPVLFLFFVWKDRRLPCDPSLFLSDDTQPGGWWLIYWHQTSKNKTHTHTNVYSHLINPQALDIFSYPGRVTSKCRGCNLKSCNGNWDLSNSGWSRRDTVCDHRIFGSIKTVLSTITCNVLQDALTLTPLLG